MSSHENDVEHEEVEIEAFAQSGGPGGAPRAKRYVVRVDKTKYTLANPMPTGRELLTIAGKVPPEQYKLRQKFHSAHGGHAETIGLDEKVDLRKPGVERFMTLKIDQTEGLEPRREFSLPDHDRRFLESTGLNWETITNGSSQWLLIHDRPATTSGYTVAHTTVALNIPAGYPDSQIDMAYFYPHLMRKDGKPIGQLAQEPIDGKSFQRWSRHRTTAAPWLPGEDDISSHLVLVDAWMEEEFRKR